MNSVIKKAVFTFFLSAGILFATAQQQTYKWMIGINGGALIYQGDLAPSAAGSYRTASPVAGFSLGRILTPYFAVRANASFGRLWGDDDKFSTPWWRQYRRFNFTTPVKEFSMQFLWNPYGNNSNETGQRFTPYVFAGAGKSFFDIKRFYGNVDTTIFPWGSVKQLGLQRDTTTALPRSAFVLPVGAGVSYYLSDRWSANYELNFRYMFTDYLDGFSYVANPKLKDFYHSHTLGLVYRFGGDNDGGGKNGDQLNCPKF